MNPIHWLDVINPPQDQGTGLYALEPIVRFVTGRNNNDSNMILRRLVQKEPVVSEFFQKVRVNGKGHMIYVADAETCRMVALHILRGQRSPIEEKRKFWTLFGASEAEKQRVYIECESIDTIQKVFHKLDSIKQMRFGQYRVDLYFPSARLCIECDEDEHKLRVEEDLERQAWIESNHGVRFFRYNPHEPSYNLAHVVAKINLLLNYIGNLIALFKGRWLFSQKTAALGPAWTHVSIEFARTL
jgi:very-short-patch-repair endonuclease